MAAPYRTWTARDNSTEPIEFQLTRDGVATNLTGITSITLQMKNVATGAWTPYPNTGGSPKLAVTDAANGKVTFSPAAGDLAFSAGSYECFFWVVDGAGKSVSFPTDQNFSIRMIDDQA